MIKRNQKGITLIALVITIIVMLILVSVTISIAVNGGLFDYAGKAVKKTSIEKEREAILAELAISQIDEYVEGESTRLGESLYDRTLENGDKWHVVTANGNVYGTNWNYVEKGTNLGDYGEAKYSWLVNYQTGEIIELEEDNYINLSAGDSLAVEDHIIFNLDSSVIDGNVSNTKDGIESNLGQGVKINGFNFNDKSGLTSTSFNFDGWDDYIDIPLSIENTFEDGLTLEFYGIINSPGHEITESGEVYKRTSEIAMDGMSGLFELFDAKDRSKIRINFFM